MSEYLSKKAVLESIDAEQIRLMGEYQSVTGYHKRYVTGKYDGLNWIKHQIESGAFDTKDDLDEIIRKNHSLAVKMKVRTLELEDEIQRLRAALEEVHEELKTLHFMINQDDDIFHERKKKYLSIIDYVGQSVAGQALPTTTEPTDAAKVERVREGDGNDV